MIMLSVGILRFLLSFVYYQQVLPTRHLMSRLSKPLSTAALLVSLFLANAVVDAACSLSTNGTTYSWDYGEDTYRRDPTQHFTSDTDGNGPAPYSNHEDCTWYFECLDTTRFPYVSILSVNLETASSSDALTIRPDDGTSVGRTYSGSVRGATYAPRVGRTQVRFVTDASGTAAGYSIQWCCQNEAGNCNVPDNSISTVLIIVIIVVIVIPLAILIGLVILCYQCCCKSDPPKQQQVIIPQPVQVQQGQAYPQQQQQQA